MTAHVARQPPPVRRIFARPADAQKPISFVGYRINSNVVRSHGRFFHVGWRVRVESGPLAGTEGIVLEVKSEWRIVVSLTLLQRSVSAEIERAWITPTH